MLALLPLLPIEIRGIVLTDKVGECPNPLLPNWLISNSGELPLKYGVERISGEGDGVEPLEPGGEGDGASSTSPNGLGSSSIGGVAGVGSSTMAGIPSP